MSSEAKSRGKKMNEKGLTKEQQGILTYIRILTAGRGRFMTRLHVSVDRADLVTAMALEKLGLVKRVFENGAMIEWQAVPVEVDDVDALNAGD